MKFNCAYTELVDIHKLQPNPRNRNNHPEKQIELLAKIIDYQGQRHPIVVSNRSGFINSGHGRLLAMEKLGWTQVAVDYQDFESEAQEYASLIADNKIAELAEHDDKGILDDLKDLQEIGAIDLTELDFDLLGLDDFSFAIAEAETVTEEQGDAVNPEPKFMFEAHFPNDMEMNDAKDELLARGFIVKVKHNG